MATALQIPTSVVVEVPLTTLPRSPPRKRDARAASGKTIKIDNHGIHGTVRMRMLGGDTLIFVKPATVTSKLGSRGRCLVPALQFQ